MSVLSMAMFLSVMERFRPGSAQKLGSEVWTIFGKVASGFFMSIGSSIRIWSKKLKPHVNYLLSKIIELNLKLTDNMSMQRYKGVGSFIHHALQSIGRCVYHIPKQYRGLTIMYVAFMGVLFVICRILKCVYSEREYNSKQLNKARFDKYIFCSTIHEDAITTNMNTQVIKYQLDDNDVQNAINWSLRSRKNEAQYRFKGLEISSKKGKTLDKKLVKLKKLIDNHSLQSDDDVHGIVFTHFDIKEEIKNKLKNYYKIWYYHADEKNNQYSCECNESSSNKNILIISLSDFLTKKNRNVAVAKSDAEINNQHTTGDTLPILPLAIRWFQTGNIGHIHFLEPTNESIKQWVYQLSGVGTSTKPFKKFVPIIPIIEFGYQKNVKQTSYEYVSLYPRWICSMFKQYMKYITGIHNEALLTPDGIILKYNYSIQNDMQAFIQALSKSTDTDLPTSTIDQTELTKLLRIQDQHTKNFNSNRAFRQSTNDLLDIDSLIMKKIQLDKEIRKKTITEVVNQMKES